MQITGTFENAGTEGTWLVEEVTVKNAPIAISRALVHPQPTTTTPIRVLNRTAEPVTLYAGTVVDTMQPVTPVDGEVMEGQGAVSTRGEWMEVVGEVMDGQGAVSA